MHSNPASFKVAMQILWNGVKGTNHHRNYFCLHIPYSSNFYFQFGVVIDLLKFFLCDILVPWYGNINNEAFSACLVTNSYIWSVMFNDTVSLALKKSKEIHGGKGDSRVI